MTPTLHHYRTRRSVWDRWPGIAAGLLIVGIGILALAIWSNSHVG